MKVWKFRDNSNRSRELCSSDLTPTPGDFFYKMTRDNNKISSFFCYKDKFDCMAKSSKSQELADIKEYCSQYGMTDLTLVISTEQYENEYPEYLV